MYYLELIKFDVSNTSYYVYGALLRSWKMILEGHGKFLGKKCGNPAFVMIILSQTLHCTNILSCRMLIQVVSSCDMTKITITETLNFQFE